MGDRVLNISHKSELYFTFCVKYFTHYPADNTLKDREQAGAELGQAQLKLGLELTLTNLH